MDILLKKVRVVLPDGRKLLNIPRTEFKAGTQTLITGASGSGKSTLLHLISGLFIPAEGHVTVGPHEFTQLSDQIRSHIRRRSFGIVFQKLNLLDHLTVRENIQITRPPEMTTADFDDRSEQALRSLHIESLKFNLTAKLSSGEQQRVAIARVIVAAPQIILADEPTSSLDDDNATVVIEGLKKAAIGKTLIVVSHDHRIWNAFANRVPFEKITL